MPRRSASHRPWPVRPSGLAKAAAAEPEAPRRRQASDARNASAVDAVRTPAAQQRTAGVFISRRSVGPVKVDAALDFGDRVVSQPERVCAMTALVRIGLLQLQFGRQQ